jgi:YfiH family protein
MTATNNLKPPHTHNNIVWLDWPAPQSVKACYSLRQNGHSSGSYSSFNLGDHVGDLAINVAKNRKLLEEIIGQQAISWLQQVHGTRVVDANLGNGCQADASYTQEFNQVCTVMTADCLPVFFCDTEGRQVALAHAGWRGLHAGVLQQTLSQFNRAGQSSSLTKYSNIIAYLGPAISQGAFEVGEDVRQAFLSLPHDQLKRGRQYFKAGRLLDIGSGMDSPAINKNNQKWMADLYGIAKDMLNNMGVSDIYGGERCTYTEADDFFSYRRDGLSGRMANLIWLD